MLARAFTLLHEVLSTLERIWNVCTLVHAVWGIDRRNWRTGSREGGADPSSLGSSDRMRRNGLKLCRRRFRLAIRKNLFTKRVIKLLNRLPREVPETPCLEVFKICVDVCLGTRFGGGDGSVQFAAGLDDLKGLFQLKGLYDALIYLSGCPVLSQGLDSMILVGPFQIRRFYNYEIASGRWMILSPKWSITHPT